MPNFRERLQGLRGVRKHENLDIVRGNYEADGELDLGKLVELGEGVARRYRLNGIYGNERLWSTVEEIADKCNLIEGVLVTISLIEKNQIHDAVYVYDVALNCLRVILEDQNGWRMNEEERWLMGVLMDRLQNYSELIISDGDKGGISRVFTGLFEKHDYLASKVAGLAVDMSRSIGVYEKEWAMRLIAKGYPPMEGACLLSEYFSDSQSQDTFFVEPAIEALGDIIERVPEYSWVTGFEVEDGVVEALKLCFVSIEQSLPVIRTRGHEKFLMNALKGLFRNHPEAKGLVSDRLLDDVERFRVRGARKIINHRGSHRGKYNTGDYEYIGQFYNGLSTQEQEKIDGMIKEGRIDEVAELVSHLFDIEQTRYLEDELFYEESEDGMVRVCLEKNQVIIELITMMADDPKYRFQMGVLLSTMDFSDLPKKLKKKVDPEKVENNFQLLLKNRNWYLCENAETRMVEALYNGSVILVDNCLLVKHKGKLSGLCLKTFTTKKGFTFIEGNWYSPVDPGTRKKIQQAYENRQSSIFTDSDCDWVLMRAIEDLDEERRADELLNEVKRVIFTTNEWETRKASFKLEPN